MHCLFHQESLWGAWRRPLTTELSCLSLLQKAPPPCSHINAGKLRPITDELSWSFPSPLAQGSSTQGHNWFPNSLRPSGSIWVSRSLGDLDLGLLIEGWCSPDPLLSFWQRLNSWESGTAALASRVLGCIFPHPEWSLGA